MDGILFMAFPRGQEKAEEVPIIIQFGFVRWKLILSLYSHFLCSREIPCPEKGDHNRILGFSHFEKVYHQEVYHQFDWLNGVGFSSLEKGV